MRKPRLQQVFWHRFFFFFLRSFSHCLSHFFMNLGFFSHFLILVLHALSLRPLQLTSGSDGDGGADGGSDSGSGSHKPQVFLHAFFFSGSLQCLFLHVFSSVSTHAGGLAAGGDSDGGGGEGLGGGGEGLGETRTTFVGATISSTVTGFAGVLRKVEAAVLSVSLAVMAVSAVSAAASLCMLSVKAMVTLPAVAVINSEL